MEKHEKTAQSGEKYALNREGVERMTALIEEYLRDLRMERTDVLRIRFALEEALLRWLDRFGDEGEVKLSMGTRVGYPTITMEMKEDPYDPLTNAENDLGEWADSLLSGIGLNPVYSYKRNTNVVQLRLKKKRMHPALVFGLAIGIGQAAGLIGAAALPAEFRLAVLQTVFDPVEGMFLRLLNTAAGPILFFSVLAAVCGVGNAATMSKSGRRLIVRFLASVSFLTVIAAAVSILVFRPGFSDGSMDSGAIHGLLDFLFRIIPTDMISPMMSGNSPQLILIAFILGHALLTVGRQTDGVVAIVEQINAVGLIIADWVGLVTPIFVSILLVLGIWSDSLDPILSLWKPAALFLGLIAVLFALQLLITALYVKAAPGLLLRKMRDSFLTAFRTLSVNSAYESNQNCCEKRFGIDRTLTKTGLPLGLLIYMPAGTVASMIAIISQAASSGIAVSPFWLLMAVLLNITLQAASPPVTGIGLLSYAVIFNQLGIPGDALITVMVLDILFGLVIPPLNQAMLQLEMLSAASHAKLLNRALLR